VKRFRGVRLDFSREVDIKAVRRAVLGISVAIIVISLSAAAYVEIQFREARAGLQRAYDEAARLQEASRQQRAENAAQEAVREGRLRELNYPWDKEFATLEKVAGDGIALMSWSVTAADETAAISFVAVSTEAALEAGARAASMDPAWYISQISHDPSDPEYPWKAVLTRTLKTVSKPQAVR
jgi:hypothetical protein